MSEKIWVSAENGVRATERDTDAERLQSIAEAARLAVRGLMKVTRADITLHDTTEIPKRVAKSEIDETDAELIPHYYLFDENGEVEDEFYQYTPTERDERRVEHPVRTEFAEEARRYEVFSLPTEITERYKFLTELPENVAVMGGMARSIAREVITGDREPIRDIDLVNILDSNQESLHDREELDRLAQKYMPDDYAFGHGIESDTLESYFRTRDFTVNEALVVNNTLIVSNFAYNDLQENIIRPTYYEMMYSGVRASSRLALRALMMQTVLSECTSSYPTIEDMRIDGDYLGSFDTAVQLNKAMSRGAETARQFTNLLAEYGAIPAELGGQPKATAKYYLKYRVQNFTFRANNDPRIDDRVVEPETIDYHATDKKVQEELDAYKSDRRAEKYEGHYTQADFDEINKQKYDYSQEEEYDDYDDYDDYYEDEDYYDEDEDS